jgi:hypothetical protein
MLAPDDLRQTPFDENHMALVEQKIDEALIRAYNDNPEFKVFSISSVDINELNYRDRMELLRRYEEKGWETEYKHSETQYNEIYPGYIKFTKPEEKG